MYIFHAPLYIKIMSTVPILTRSTNRPWMSYPYLLTSIPLQSYINELKYNYLNQQVKINCQTIGTVVDMKPIKNEQAWFLQYSIRLKHNNNIKICIPELDNIDLEILI